MNRLFTRLLAPAFIICLAATASAQTQLPTDSTVRKGTLANGLTYYLRHNARTPGQADFYLANRVGSILEEPEQRGLAHFLEHMAFNGTEHFPYGNGETGSVRGWCESKGIKFGADLNASTSIDRTLYNIANAPVAKAGVTDTCLLILSDWSGALLLRGDEIDRERGVIREEWRTRRSQRASSRMMEDAMPTIYRGSKYEDCLPIGHIEVIDTFRHESLRDFYNKWYRPDLQAVVVVGDINVDDVEDRIKSLFGAFGRDGRDVARHPERIYYPVPDNDEMIVYTQANDEQPTLNFSLYMKRDAEPLVSRNTREAYVEGYKSRLAMFILRQRLQQLTKQAPLKVISVGCRDNGFYVTPDEKDAFALTVGLLPNAPQEGIDAAIEIVEKARRYGFTESELGHAKDQLAVSLNHDLDNKDNTPNATYVHEIIDHFCNDEPLLDIEYKAALEAELASAVTLEEVNEAVKEIVIDDNQVCIVFGPTFYGTAPDGSRQPYEMPSRQQFRQWIEAAQQRDYPDDFNNDFDQDFTFMKQLPEKGEILAKHVSTNGYTEYLLSNGIRVHARPSKLEPNRLTINMFRLGGRSLYGEDDAATLAMWQSVVRQSGAADFDYLTLEEKRRGKALRVTPYINMEEEGVNGVCVANDLKAWLEICHLYLTQPRRDDAIFQSLIERQRAMSANRTASPNVVYNDSLRLVIYGENGFTRPLTTERLAEVDLDRIYQIHHERFSDLSGMNLIITGDIPGDFEELLCSYVASLPGKRPSDTGIDDTPATCGAHPGKTFLDIRPVNETHTFHIDRATPIATTNIVYSAPVPYTAENDLKADVLAQILRSIYTEKVRQEQGGTYGVTVESQCWRYPHDGCSMTISFRCDPESLDTLLPIIEQQLAHIADEGLTDEQLHKVKEYELKNYDRAILTNGWWEYVRYHELHDGIDFNRDYPHRVAALTPDAIRDFARLLLAPNHRLQITMN